MNNYTIKIDTGKEALLREFFARENAAISAQQYAFWRAKTSKYTAIFYNSGKFLVQGADVSEIATKVEAFLGIKSVPPAKTPDIAVPAKHIGVDESGKGDFFGPLVIAGVLTDENSSEILLKAGIKDCKKVSDAQIPKLAAAVKNNCVFSIVTINPAKYNELYAKFGNLNKLLAWGHARTIENILEKADCEYALSDKFGDEKLIKNALMGKGQNIKLEQRCKAESDIAVAAASILAREQFLKIMADFSSKYGVQIPKGCNSAVIDAAREIAGRFSKDELKNLVKTHFKTFQEL